MITVNELKMEWKEGLTLQDLYQFLGYRLKNPMVLVTVDGVKLGKEEMASYIVKDGSVIEVVSFLRGG